MCEAEPIVKRKFWFSLRGFRCDLFTSLQPFCIIIQKQGLPQRLSGEESACQCRRPEFSPWVKEPWRRKWQPTHFPTWPGKSHGQRSLVGYIQIAVWGHKESDRTWPPHNNNLETGSILKTLKKKNPSLFFFAMSVSFKDTKGLKLSVYEQESLLP